MPINPDIALPMKHGYRSDIDGLRAIAVFSILFYHLGFGTFGNGYLGVDIFFVISGFLITRIVQQEMATGEFSFADFYERRARRIMPSALATLAFSLIGAFLLFSPKELVDFADSLLSALGFASNIYFWEHINYFTDDTHLAPLLNLWSLGVEVQFYLVWPLLLVFLRTASSNYNLYTTIVIVGTLSLAAVMQYNDIDPNATFYLLPFRMFEFLIGSAGVLLMAYPAKYRVISEMATILGMVLILIAVTGVIPVTPYPDFYSLVPCIGTTLVIYGGGQSKSRWLLANPASVFIGLISYELYLIHWPVLIFYQQHLLHAPAMLDKLIIILITSVLAVAVYYGVDKPLRRTTDRRQCIRFALAILGAIAVLSAAAISMKWNEGWSWRIEERFRILKSDPLAYHEAEFGGTDYEGHDPYTLGDATAAPSFIFFGDSFAMQYAGALDRLLKENHRSAIAVFQSSCLVSPDAAPINHTPDDDLCNATYAKVQSLFAGNTLPVVDAQNWTTYSEIIADKATHTKLHFTSDADYYHFVFGQIDKIWQEVGPQRKFVVIGVAPGMGDQQGVLDCFSMPTYIPNDCAQKVAKPLAVMTTGLQFDIMAAAWAKQHSNATFLNPRDVLCNDTICWAFKGTELYYSDYIHLSNAGAWLFVDHFRDVFLGL